MSLTEQRTVRRGDLVLVSLRGDIGKPRPGPVVQADSFADLAHVVVLQLSGTLIDAPLSPISIKPSVGNGLDKPSQIAIVARTRKDRNTTTDQHDRAGAMEIAAGEMERRRTEFGRRPLGATEQDERPML